ncbi:cytochrome P450 [Aspergillus arachidicola]|uniref:Cytochrome P450 n=1 Tax=Aspergillus arachidicola TaxID=656916 RepID=A0A2G7FN25_9EURO|nr:cytochrome P450 [Aspergillus arachidicola]
MFQLALHPEYQDIIRREIHDLIRRDSSPVPISELDMRTLRKASCTNSFIREVLRMKGDAVNLVRMARRDVKLGGFTIPKKIKLAVFALLADARLELVGGKYNVADRFNVTGNPPEGELVFKRIGAC